MMNVSHALSAALRVQSVDRYVVRLPFRPVPARHLKRQNDRWKYFELCRVTLEGGESGLGETMLFYTWGRVTDDSVRRTIGRGAHELMWDDSLGPGLQQALLDAVSRTLCVPLYSIIGERRRERVPVAWWAIDMSLNDLRAECDAAVQAGYTSLKTKGRPWFDVIGQHQALGQALPGYFSLSWDFNGSLRSLTSAMSYLKTMEDHGNVFIFEEPLDEARVADYVALRQAIRSCIALHARKLPDFDTGRISLDTMVRHDMSTGFVVARGGTSSILRQGHYLDVLDKPYWLQVVGSGITARFAVHMAAVLEKAVWPVVSAHEIFEPSCGISPLQVVDGHACIDDQPGSGVEVDENLLRRHLCDIPAGPELVPRQLICLKWPSGGCSYYSQQQQYWREFTSGQLHPYQEGVELYDIPDDGSVEWRDLVERTRERPVHSARPRFVCA